MRFEHDAVVRVWLNPNSSESLVAVYRSEYLAYDTRNRYHFELFFVWIDISVVVHPEIAVGLLANTSLPLGACVDMVNLIRLLLLYY